MNYSLLKNAEAGTVFNHNGEDVIVSKHKVALNSSMCQYCLYATGKRDSSKGACTAPRSTGTAKAPCGRGGLATVRFIPLHVYAKLRIKGEL